ncbi:MAG TPA: hypothetical protein VFB72_19755, partial [Verrucomicrobiae bacterium]|nr:hypothetical protein [Verrucomicrobiae bacterium]
MNTLEIKPPETTPEHNTLDGSHTVIVRVAVPDEIATLTGQFPAGNFVGTTLLAQAIIAQVGASLPQVHHYNELNKALIIIACGHLPLETVKEAALSVLKKCRLEKFAVIAYAHLAEDFFPELHRGEMAILLPQHTRQSF